MTDVEPIDPDIRRARTPDRAFYGDGFSAHRERIFARAWLMATTDRDVPAPGHAEPVDLLPDCLDEPVALTRDAAGRRHALANVCTHRGHRVVLEAGPCTRLRCRYHGRRFELDGRLHHAPGFEDAVDFPRPEDDLPRAPLGDWEGLPFTGVDPDVPFDEWIAPVRERLAFWQAPPWKPRPDATTDHAIEAPWALYVDNYLEGFHVPYVHPTLARAIELPDYRIERLPHGVLQTAGARPEDPAFEPPAGHPDHGRRVAAYWFWLFPSTMLNLYPWGLSINLVEPRGPRRTVVRYATYVRCPGTRETGAGADLARVEREDQEVVVATASAIRSRRWRRGRYAPRHEQGVHHFHRLAAARLAGNDRPAGG